MGELQISVSDLVKKKIKVKIDGGKYLMADLRPLMCMPTHVHMHPHRHANTHLQRRSLVKMFEIPNLWFLLDPSVHQTNTCLWIINIALTMSSGVFLRCLSFGLDRSGC